MKNRTMSIDDREDLFVRIGAVTTMTNRLSGAANARSLEAAVAHRAAVLLEDFEQDLAYLLAQPAAPEPRKAG